MGIRYFGGQSIGLSPSLAQIHLAGKQSWNSSKANVGAGWGDGMFRPVIPSVLNMVLNITMTQSQGNGGLGPSVWMFFCWSELPNLQPFRLPSSRRPALGDGRVLNGTAQLLGTQGDQVERGSKRMHENLGDMALLL